MQNMVTIWISTVLLLLFRSVSSELVSGICTRIKKSDGLIPPPLPTNFEMKGESVDNLNNYTVYEEMYFDYTNSRAKYVYMNRSIAYNLLFDYETSQIVEWRIVDFGVSVKTDPFNQECKATDMDESQYSNIFGYESYPRPKMFNSNQALRYGGQYSYAFNGTKKIEERGLMADSFIGCLYDSTKDATMKTNYFFSNEKLEPSGATSTKKVIGFDDGYLSVPILMKYEGVMPNKDKKIMQFDKTLSISWFKAEPEFAQDTFQIPPWVYCKNYRGRKVMPKFPTAFSTRLTVTEFQLDAAEDMDTAEVGIDESQSYEVMFYYGEKNLARRDFTPNFERDDEITKKFQSDTPVSTIYDFNQGLRYAINIPTGRCYIRYMHKEDYFVDQDFALGLKLATPEQVFNMENDEMEYKGKAFTRDIECDVWTGLYTNKEDNITYVKETYISTNGWHEYADEKMQYGVPIKHVLLSKYLSDDLLEGIVTYNFLKLKNKPPRLAMFDINNCVEYIKHQQYAIILDVSTETRQALFNNEFSFLETAQYYLTDMTQVLTPLRIQRLEIRQKLQLGGNNLMTFLVFTLLGKYETSEPVSIAGASFEDAIVNLQRVVDRGAFNINFQIPDKEPVIVTAQPGDLYIVKAGGNLSLAPLHYMQEADKERSTDSSFEPLVQRDDKSDENVEVKEENGMTPGHLALLSFAMLFIGVGVGIAAMYLYVRFYDERHVEDKIAMTYSKEQSDESSLDNESALS